MSPQWIRNLWLGGRGLRDNSRPWGQRKQTSTVQQQTHWTPRSPFPLDGRLAMRGDFQLVFSRCTLNISSEASETFESKKAAWGRREGLTCVWVDEPQGSGQKSSDDEGSKSNSHHCRRLQRIQPVYKKKNKKNEPTNKKHKSRNNVWKC